EAAVVARCRDRKHAGERETVGDHRTNHFEMSQRLVEPAKGLQQPAVDLPRARQTRGLRRSVHLAQRPRSLAQRIEQRQWLRGTGHGTESRPGARDAHYAKRPTLGAPRFDHVRLRNRGAWQPSKSRFWAKIRRLILAPPMALLDIKNVTRRFGDFVAVDGVSL